MCDSTVAGAVVFRRSLRAEYRRTSSVGEHFTVIARAGRSVGSGCGTDSGSTARKLHVHRPFQGGSIMSKDSTTKANVKKKGKTIKEKQTAKRLKRDEQNGHSSSIPATGH
jgi:hypothetical protein